MYLAVGLTLACSQFLWTCFATTLMERELAVAQGSLCYVNHPDSVILENKLYFMSGSYTFEGGDTTAWEAKLFWLDLNTSFPLDTTISPNILQSMTAPGHDYAGVGAMFIDPLMSTFYHYYFDGIAVPSHTTLPSFNATTQTWKNASISGGSLNAVNQGGALSATASTSGLGLSFITGGPKTDISPGMITFDASNPNNLTWTNKTQGTPHLDVGTMQYVRFGNKGVLIAFGGYTDDDLYSMSLIHVYDIDSDTWFDVTATGDVPLNRSEFCSVISASPDDSSFQITLYGGYNYHEATALNDVYVLAIPAFRYIYVNSTNNVETLLNAGRYQMSCSLYKDRQMMVLGGAITLDDNNVEVNVDSCNASWGAIRQLDTTTFKWQDNFNPDSEPYEVPDQVSNIIGGGPSGGATLISPSGGFNDSALGPIFKKTIPRVTIDSASTFASTSPTVNSTSAQGSASNIPSSSSSKSMGAIDGGIIGGIVIIAVVSASVYVFYDRRPKCNWLQQKGTTDEGKKFELSSHPSVLGRSRDDNVHEVHGDHRPSEIDSNALVESPPGFATGAPLIYELSA